MFNAGTTTLSYNHAEQHWREVHPISFPIMAEGTLADLIVIEDCVVSSSVKILEGSKYR